MPRVQVAPDDIQRFAQCKPYSAIEEFIWNGLDAGGTRVEVAFQKRVAGDVLEVIDAIEIRDFGEGVPLSRLEASFGNVGGSLKATNRLTPEGRLRHGQFGRGRFTFLVLGSRATWTTTYRDNGTLWTYEITVDRSTPEYYEHTEPVAVTSGSTGTILRITQLSDGVKVLRASAHYG